MKVLALFLMVVMLFGVTPFSVMGQEKGKDLSGEQKLVYQNLLKEIQIQQLQYQLLRDRFEQQFLMVPQVKQVIDDLSKAAKEKDDFVGKVLAEKGLDKTKFTLDKDGKVVEVKSE